MNNCINYITNEMIKNKVLQCLKVETFLEKAGFSVVVVLKLFLIQRHPLNLGLAHFGLRFCGFN